MNPSNLPQLRRKSGQMEPMPNVEVEAIYEGEYVGQTVSTASMESNHQRRRSGSYMGASESEDEISFKGNDSSLSGYERLPPLTNCPEEEKIKRKLKFFFMNPAEKYYATRKIPWKLCLQIIKVFLVTSQLWIFADYRFAHVNFYTDQTITFQHLFLKGWDPAREIHAYPQSLGKLALYRKSDFYGFVDYAVKNLARIEEDSMGPFFRNSSFGLCLDHYKFANISSDLNIELDNTIVTDCKFISKHDLAILNSSTWRAEDWLRDFPLPWISLERMFLNFSLTTVSLSPMGPVPAPDCFKFDVQIEIDNRDHDGQFPIDLKTEPVRLECPGQKITSSRYSEFIVFLNLGVIIICLFSLLLCLRALLRAQLLKHETGAFVQKSFGWNLTVNERLEFLNLWYHFLAPLIF